MRPETRTLSSAATSDPIVVDYQQKDFKLALQVALAAGSTLTYSVESTLDDPEADYSTDFNTDANWFPVTGLDAATASAQGNVFFPVRAVRLRVSAFTSGSATLTAIQPTDY